MAKRVMVRKLAPVADVYECLANQLSSRISSSSSCVVIAESFSGPIAVKLATRHSLSIAAIVLVASFVTPPIPAVARLLPWSLAFHLPLPTFAARWAMLGRSAPDDLVRVFKRSVRETPPKVLAQRVRQLICLDASKELSAVKCPIMYLRPSADRLVPQRCIDAIQRLQIDLHFREIDGPHLLLQRQPVRAWSAISEFLHGISALRKHASD